MSRTIRLLSIVFILVVLPVQAAKACSCAYGDPRDMFEAADGAFVGTFVESHPVEPDPTSSDADTVYTFVLDEEHKGELGEPGGTVEVHAPLSGASCGLEVRPGRQYGIFLYVREPDGAWESSLCSQVSPETMREAASPLPAPTSNDPVRMIAGGSFGDAQTMMLDADGDTVGYGFGDIDVEHVAGCRGGARVIEIGRDYPARPILFVRDVSSLEVVESVELPVGRRRGLSVEAVTCLSESGRRSAVFATNYREPEAYGVLLTIAGDDVDVVHEGDGRSATFAGRGAYLQRGRWGRLLTRVSLRTGNERFVALLPPRVLTGLALSPDGSRLAGISYPRWHAMDERASRVYTVDLPGGRIRTASLGRGERDAQVLWWSRSRLVMFVSYPDRSRVYDLRLRVRNRFARWEPSATAIVDGTAYGAGFEGRLWEVDLPAGEPKVARRLPSPVVYALEPLD
ncbi:MAG: hypothetical protein ABR613_06450 [Actinomycetota bacterium]